MASSAFSTDAYQRFDSFPRNGMVHEIFYQRCNHGGMIHESDVRV